MRYFIPMIAFLCFIWQGLSAQEVALFDPPLSPRIANYEVQVTLNDTARTLAGTATLTWSNPSDDLIPDLRFHLYYNAFQNARSTFIRERNGYAPWAQYDGWGWIRITNMKVRGKDETVSLRYIQPDDDNDDDQTVLQVVLSEPVLPRETIRMEMDFEIKIPVCKRRWGWWGDDFFFLGQWLPKIGVYETAGMRFIPADAPHGEWNCHQFHNSTEFYADFGVYDVAITLPQKYTVGASGIIVKEELHGDSTKTVYVHAEDVHDFAWVADASIKVITDTWRNPATGKDVTIRLLLQPGHDIARDTYLKSTEETLQFFEEWLGPNAYPYSQVTVLDPPPGSSAGGMEYPTLFTGRVRYLPYWMWGDGYRLLVNVTVHEAGHQYFYGMIANNEFEESFLDESFATYIEHRVQVRMFGREKSGFDMWGIQSAQELRERIGYVLYDGKQDARLTDIAYKDGSVRGLIYSKGAVALKTLENLLGREKFDRFMNTFYQRWRFKHPGYRELVVVANEVTGEDISWYFDQVFAGYGVVDYAVANFRSIPVEQFNRGEHLPVSFTPDEEAADTTTSQPDSLSAVLEDSAAEAPPKIYLSKVKVRNLGDVKLPVKILIEFDDGSNILEKWDGQERKHTFVYEKPAKITKVVIDPERKILLDVNLMNNSKTPPNKQFERKYKSKWFFWMQSLFALFASIS